MALPPIDRSSAPTRTYLPRTAPAATQAAQIRPIPDPGGGDSFSVDATRIGVNSPQYPQALALERQLSEARVKLGEAQLRSDQRGGWTSFLDRFRKTDLEREIDTLSAEVGKLEKAEGELSPKDAVHAARFQVFRERLPAIEQRFGKETGARLVRQVYYNDFKWNDVAADSASASQAELNLTGLPRTPIARTPNGEQLDLGHVAAGLDWGVNRRGSDVYNLNTVTVTGDIASAMNSANGAGDAGRAIRSEGDADWNGDLDGHNLARRYQADPNQSLTSLVSGYYAGAYKNRSDEWLRTTSYKKPDGSLDTVKLTREAISFSDVLATRMYGGPDGSTIKAVVNEFQGWLSTHGHGVANID